jgi:hypothetical protein
MVGFPLLLIPIAIYNIIVFLMPGVSFAEPILKLTLMSGTEWPVTLNDIMLALAVLMLLFEVIKGARPGAKFLMDHLLSLIVFGCAAAEFVLWPKFGNSTYCLLALLALVDFLSGIALRARRGAVVAVSPKVSSRAAKKAAAAAAAEPSFEPAPVQVPVSAPVPVTVPAPAPASSVPAAASVAESVLLDRSEPKLTPPVVAANSARPEEVSPGLQPSNGGPPPSPDVLPPSR